MRCTLCRRELGDVDLETIKQHVRDAHPDNDMLMTLVTECDTEQTDNVVDRDPEGTRLTEHERRTARRRK